MNLRFSDPLIVYEWHAPCPALSGPIPMSATASAIVLLVQPSRDDGLEMYEEFLRYNGLAPITVTDARNALMLAPDADIIVTGITLDDDIDGVEVVSRLRHDGGTMHKPIIVLTACAWRTDRARAKHAGCDAFLPKPCLPIDLLREVRRLLRATKCDSISPGRRRKNPSASVTERLRPNVSHVAPGIRKRSVRGASVNLDEVEGKAIRPLIASTCLKQHSPSGSSSASV